MTTEVVATWGDVLATGLFIVVVSFGAGMVVSAISDWWRRMKK